MSRSRRTFTPEFKRKAVELTRTSSKTVAQIARDIDVGETALRRWIEQAARDRGDAPASEALTSSEREELKELRRKVRQLEQEREILKKATAFFARENS
jgi:transposase